MGKISAFDQIRLGGGLLSGSGSALWYAGHQLAQGANAVNQTQQVIAGSGLEGGGAFNNGDITLNVGGGSGIVVNSDKVHIDQFGVINSMIAPGAIDNSKVANSAAINVSKLQYSGFTLQGGSGLDPSSQIVNLGSTVTLNVSTDNSTVVINSDKVSVGTITNSNISDASINPTKLVHSGISIYGGSGLQPDFSTVNLGNAITINVATDGSSIDVNSDKLRVKPLGIANSHIAEDAAISVTKLSLSGITIVGGSGIQPNGAVVNLGEALELNVVTDNSTLEVNSDALRIKSLGINNSHISNTAGISVTKLNNSGVNFSYANGLTGSLTTNLGQTNNLTLNLNPDTLSAPNNTLRVVKVTGLLSQGAHAGINAFTYDGSSNVAITVDNTVVRTTGNQIIAGDKFFENTVRVEGDFIVSGNVYAVSSNEVLIGDNKIVLNADATTAIASDGGIIVHTGISGKSPELIWSQNNKSWQVTSNPSGGYYNIISTQTARAGVAALTTVDGSSKIVYFNHTFESVPSVVATVKAPAGYDLIGVQVNDVTTTGVGFDFTTSIPINSIYTLNWHALST
jgi:hypothetical protein